MNTQELAIAEANIYICPELESLIEQLIQENEKFEQELAELKRSKQYTPEIRKQMNALEVKIQDNNNKKREAEDAKKFTPNLRVVRFGGNKPGRVVYLQVIGRVIEILVLWDNATAPVPERAAKLQIVDPKKCEYIWNGERHSKLIRPIDNHECDDVGVLAAELSRLELEVGSTPKEWQAESKARASYCRKRIDFFTKGIKFLSRQMTVEISKINRNGVTQQRTKLNSEVVSEYADFLQAGVEFPPVKLLFDGKQYWLIDGHHTTEAAWSIGRKVINAIVSSGSEREAILASTSANISHGLRRTNADKRKAVTTLLTDSEWGQWSNREIARRCNVSDTFVGKVKSSLTANVCSDNPKKYKDKHGNESVMETKNIGLIASQQQEQALLNHDGEFVNAQGKKFNPKDMVTPNCNNSCPELKSTIQTNSTISNSDLVKRFEVGQLVKLQLLNFGGASESLRMANHSHAQITSFTESGCSLCVSVLESDKNFIVSPQDIQAVDLVDFKVSFSSKQFIALISIYKTKQEIINSMKLGVLGK